MVKPPLGISTAEAYRHVTRHPEAEETLIDLLRVPLASWRDTVVNDFEPFAFARYPELRQLRDQLYSHGALYAAMSGSGTAIYGIFAENPLDSATCTLGELLAQYPTWVEQLP